MAFADGGKGTEYIPICHGCGRKCKGRWRKCPHITEEHRAKVAALDAAGHFRRGNNNNNNNNNGKSKKGAVNIATGAGKDDGGNESKDEATKAKDSSVSELTEDMTISELQRLTGYIHTNIGMSEVNGETCEDDGS